jgi:DNA modification methylase
VFSGHAENPRKNTFYSPQSRLMQLKVINGDNLEILKNYPDNYFDAVVTDPPYGLGKEPNAEELMKDWIEKGYHEVKGSGFMGKDWDAFVPQPIFWKEVFRVLKHGGHVVSFFGTRTYDWGVMAMRFAGFEVRDCIQWLYGSGFPKSHNISKAIDKMYGAEREVGKLKFKGGSQLGVMNDDEWKPKDVFETAPATDQAKQWDGWGSALKPANEPIVLARKPLEKGLSIAENVLKWGTGGINIDGCRVGNEIIKGKKAYVLGNGINMSGGLANKDYIPSDSQGRFPANLILTHHPECECVGIKKVKAIKGGKGENSMGGMGKNGIYGEYALDKLGANAGGLGDENGEEQVEDWNCHPECPIKILDEQSGESKSSKSAKLYVNDTEGRSVKNGASGHRSPNSTYADKGGASRFFYVAKASKSERNKGLEGFEEKRTNFHPCVKPIKLMQYLARLITPPNGIVLDPFCGSGTTGLACKLDGFQFIGLEQDLEYSKIAEARIRNYVEGKETATHIAESNELTIKTKLEQLNLFNEQQHD